MKFNQENARDFQFSSVECIFNQCDNISCIPQNKKNKTTCVAIAITIKRVEQWLLFELEKSLPF
jgi:hypothetical protein